MHLNPARTSGLESVGIQRRKSNNAISLRVINVIFSSAVSQVYSGDQHPNVVSICGASPDFLSSMTDTHAKRAEPLPEVNRSLSNEVEQRISNGHVESTYDGSRFDEKKPDDSRETSSSTSPSPSHHEDEDGDEDKTIVSFDEHDPTNPYNWSTPKKLYTSITCMVMVLNSTIGSSIPSGASGELQKYFNIKNQYLLVLPNSIFLIGYILGPMIFAPLSEHYGRKIVMISTFLMFTAFVLGCALAPTFAGLVVFRLLVGIAASTPISVIGGIYADIYNTARGRGTAVASFMAATTWGPVCGPLISGYMATVSWRWVFWVELIFAGVTWPFLLAMPETFGPVLLRRKAEKLRKETGNEKILAPAELEKQDFWELCSVVLTRPIRMVAFEAIVFSTCMYLSLAYGIFYIFFQAYPIIFEGTYGFNAGQTGLTLLPIGVGSIFAAAIYLWWDYYLDKKKKEPNPPAWSQKEEYLRLPLALLGGPLFVISLFWLGWSARPDVHWIVPTLAALPFGIGFLLIFMALINYVVDAYEIYAASAMGATSACRSIFGVVLPFAAAPLYNDLGIAWACTLLGLLSALMCIIPFVFIKYGTKLRENSKFCQEIRQQKAKNEEKQRSQWERQRKSRQESSDLAQIESTIE